MIKLDYTKLVVGEDVRSLPDYSVEKMVKNLFITAANKKFERGASLEAIRTYGKVIDKLDSNEELSDEQFKFLKEAFKADNLPLATLFVVVADWLEEQGKKIE
jgi:hypothetical protein